jgi:hypothetical protein
MRGRRALILSAAAAVLLGGCGSSRLSHDDFVAKADSICRQYHAQTAKLPLPRTLGAYRTYAQRALAIYRDSLARLERLRPPAADATAVARWLTRDRVIEQDVLRLERAAAAANRDAFDAALAQAKADDARSAKLARGLGLRVCAKA